MPLIECVPNFSEGRDLTVVAAIRDAIAAATGASVLDWSADAWHHRSVITFVAPDDRIVDAAFAGIVAARERIDIREHRGVHPRIGAADVIPFIPLDGATIADCVALARTLGERVGRELEIPVYLYGEAAVVAGRVLLSDVRRGQLEGLRETIGVDPARAPDFGPARVHPTFGAIAIGARPLLVAFNCFLGDARNLSGAREIARAVRESSGGLRGVRALALEVDGQAQLSMNLVDLASTPVHVAYERVRREALARGLTITRSELIGLIPEDAVDDAAAHALRLPPGLGSRVLERLVRAVGTASVPLAAAVPMHPTVDHEALERLLDATARALALCADPGNTAPARRAPADSDPGRGASAETEPRRSAGTQPQPVRSGPGYAHALPAQLATLAQAAIALADSMGQGEAAARLREAMRAGQNS